MSEIYKEHEEITPALAGKEIYDQAAGPRVTAQ